MRKVLLWDLRGCVIGLAACAVVAFVPACRTGRTDATRPPGVDPRGGGPSPPEPHGDVLTRSDRQATADEELAATDPLAFLRRCRTNYVEQTRDYRCLFTRQELLRNGLSEVQEIKVAFREQPFSVDMRWVAHPGRARRVTYVADRWSKDGRQRARIELNGLAGLLFPGGIKLDIHGPMMSAESRSSIDGFGFKRTLDAIIETCERFQDDPGYQLTYQGIESLADRPCYLFERILPSRGLQPARNVEPRASARAKCSEKRVPRTFARTPGSLGVGRFAQAEACGSGSSVSRRLKPAAQGSGDDRSPDRLLLIYIDCEWLVPSGCFAYSDDAREHLLGSYVLTDVAFNVGLTDADF